MCRAQQYIQSGRRIVVDIDLERFFDRVNHDVLMERLARRISDGRLLRLMRRYLEAGWKRGTTTYRELRARGMPHLAAAQVAANARSWVRNSRMYLHLAIRNADIDSLGVPRLAA